MGNWAHGEAMPPDHRSDPGPMHMPYSVLSAPQNTVGPSPYETLDNDNTYTPFLKKK